VDWNLILSEAKRKKPYSFQIICAVMVVIRCKVLEFVSWVIAATQVSTASRSSSPC